MKTLKHEFRKNGLDYNLINQTAQAALFELRLPEGELAGYEVSAIHFNKEGVRFGQYFEASESIPSNDQFGFDGSKSFFPSDFDAAKKYLFDLSNKIAKIRGGVDEIRHELPLTGITAPKMLNNVLNL